MTTLTLVGRSPGSLILDAPYPLTAVSVYNAKDYGAKADGATDDTSAVQSAITACINAGGGRVHLPAGTYKINGTLDFSALHGARQQLWFTGAGTGGWSQGNPAAAATVIKQTAAATALKAYATSASSGIYGLRFEGFTVYCTVALGSGVYAVDWNGVAAMGGMRDLFVQGAATGVNDGGGVRVANPFNGQLHFENVVGADFKTGDGFRLSVETIGGVTATNSGNVTLTNVGGFNCNNGIHVTAATNLLDAVTINTPKGYGSANYDILLDGTYVSGVVINAPHCEGGANGGIYIDTGAEGTVINGGFVEGGSNADGLSCIYVKGPGTKIHGTVLQNHQYGITVDGVSGVTAETRTASGYGTPTVATMFREINGATSNALWKAGDFRPGQTIAYVEQTSNVTVSSTTEATPTDVVSSGAITYDGREVEIEVSAPWVINGATANSETVLCLWDNTTEVGRIGRITGANTSIPFFQKVRVIPSAGSHTYKVRAFSVVSAGTVVGGAWGGGAAYMPIYIKVKQV